MDRDEFATAVTTVPRHSDPIRTNYSERALIAPAGAILVRLPAKPYPA
jgi:hypothetical protein